MIKNKLNFFFKNQIWHLGGTIVLFYIGTKFVNLDKEAEFLSRESIIKE